MKKMMTAVCMAALMGATAAAQTGSAPMGKMDQMDKGKMGKPITVTGCVAAGTESEHYKLTSGMMKGETTGKSYDLMGGELKAHLGHKVEITGTMVDPKAMGKDKMMPMDKMDKEKMEKMHKDEMGKDKMSMAGMHLHVTSVKMISATCP